MSMTNRWGASAPAAAVSTLFSFAVVLGLGWAGGATRAFGDDKAKTDALKAIEGTWQSKEDEGIESKWTFEGTTLKATVNGVDYTCKVQIDPESKPHPTLDLAIDEGPEDVKGKISKAIYKLDGEKLTLCVSVPGKNRPKDFAQVEDESYLFELKKQKKA